MINQSCHKGFVLPFTLILSSAVLVLATLLLKQGEFQFEQRSMAMAHVRTKQTLTQNAHGIKEYIEEVFSVPIVATFLERDNISSGSGYRTGIYLRDRINTHTLGSRSSDEDSDTVTFKSPVSGIIYNANLINLSDKKEFSPTHFGWALEDISLSSNNRKATDWWPLPEWQMGPIKPADSVDHVFKEITGTSLDSIDWIPQDHPIPFNPQKSPAFTPVVTSAEIRFGIFASGNVGHREKVIRIRYYMNCGLWNPYSRVLRFHGRSTPAPGFQMVFWNLPKFRISNLSKGFSTDWIEMDELINTQTGAEGFHGWIRVKGELEPGESIIIREPDTKNQPEGLARTVHPAFMIGPADRIHVEFQQNEKGCSIACLSLEEDNPVASARTGRGWFRIEDFHVDMPDMEFNRADDPNRPFYLAAGSLSFREEHAQVQMGATRRSGYLEGTTDPRRRVFNEHAHDIDCAGNDVPDKDLLNFTATSLRKESSPASMKINLPALFSWPTRAPDSLMVLADIPEWKNAFRIGTKGAEQVNGILDNHWPLVQDRELIKMTAANRTVSYRRSFPINTISKNTWYSFLSGLTEPPGSHDPYNFALYPSPIGNADFIQFDDITLRENVESLSFSIQKNPSSSISDFFNKGSLLKVFDLRHENPLHQLLPLRGLLYKDFRLVTRGSAFILHLACFTTHDDVMIKKTARVWLLEVPADGSREQFSIVRFEWTNPSIHLANIN